jgi:predicted nuclease of restriction endonuclease-like (RecB) superfamily
MSKELLLLQSSEYRDFLADLKGRIHAAQMRSALAANAEMIGLYWYIGRSIIQLQQEKPWGNAVVKQLSADLIKAYPGISGFSRTNLFAMRQMVLFFDPQSKIVPQAVGQLPWGHIRVILAKIKDLTIADFYLKGTVAYGWSRDILVMQIEQRLHEREGKSVTNFQTALPKPQSDLAQQTLKDPYIFDFMTLAKDAKEQEIERQLIQHIAHFLMELGKGFAFMGSQYPMHINNKDYFLDLLFYHVNLRCFVVIELKKGEFKPEYAGKVNFYLSAVDDLMRGEHDNPSIGIILCKNRDKLDVEYALRDINKPIGVSAFQFNEMPVHIQSQLPTVEELEQELTGLTEKPNE